MPATDEDLLHHREQMYQQTLPQSELSGMKQL